MNDLERLAALLDVAATTIHDLQHAATRLNYIAVAAGAIADQAQAATRDHRTKEPQTMTDTPSTETPELEALTCKLALVRPEWLPAALVASLRRRAGLQAMSRLLAERAAFLEAQLAALVADVQTGIVSASTADTLTDLHAQLAAVRNATQVLPADDLDADAVSAALTPAQLALYAVTLNLTPISYVQEHGEWRAACDRTGQTLDPPLSDDRSRELVGKWQVVHNRVAEWNKAAESWAETTNGGALHPRYSVLDYLVSAQEQIGQAAALAPDLDAMNALVADVNSAREQAGLVWSVNNQRSHANA